MLLLDNGFYSQNWVVQLSRKIPPWKIPHWIQQQHVVNLILFFYTIKETFRSLEIFGLPRTIEASLKLPAGAGNLLPVTCGNSRQPLPDKKFCLRQKRVLHAEQITCGLCKKIYTPNLKSWGNTEDHSFWEHQSKCFRLKFKILFSYLSVQMLNECFCSIWLEMIRLKEYAEFLLWIRP